MTSEDISEKAQSLVAGKKSVKIDYIWDYKDDYMGRGGLFRRSGGQG